MCKPLGLGSDPSDGVCFVNGSTKHPILRKVGKLPVRPHSILNFTTSKALTNFPLDKLCPIWSLTRLFRLQIPFFNTSDPGSLSHEKNSSPCASFDTQTPWSFLSSPLPALLLSLLPFVLPDRNVCCLPIVRRQPTFQVQEYHGSF